MSKLAIAGGTPVRTRPFAAWPVFDDREKRALLEVLESGSWGGYNSKIGQFEQAFAKFHEVKYAVAASNGTVTLEAALSAAGIGRGDEVIVPPITFIATAAAVLRVGATPVFADIASDYNLDPAAVSAAITGRSRAIIVVHFAGRPADMDAMEGLARRHGLVIIEDAAHAHGAAWRGRPVGNFSEIASFSFQQSKNLTAGEGGILISNHAGLIDSIRSIFNQGRVAGGAWYEHENLGTNQRMTAWQAAVLLSQLERLPEQLGRRARNAAYLDDQLRGLEFVQPLPPDPRVTRHSHYLFMIRLKGLERDSFTKALTAEGMPGVGSYPHPLYRNGVFEKFNHRRLDCPEAERMCRESFWVSHEIMLSDRHDVDDFVSALAKVGANAAELSPVRATDN